MADRIDRRSLLGAALAAGIVPRCATAEPATAPGKLGAYQYGSSIWLRAGHRMMACYRTGPTQKYPYFHPLAGPGTGLSMTEEAGDPYPHHRSVLFGCDHVNGFNFWQEGPERGQITSTGATFEAFEDRVIIRDRCQWKPPKAEPILEDQREFTLMVPDASSCLLDAVITLRATTDVTITKTNHSLFAIRAAHELTPAGGGTLVNAHGDIGEKATFGKPSAWCRFEGKRCGVTESIALLDHPDNPWSPCPWFTRDYGFISPTPFFWIAEPWHLAPGQSVRLRYRLIALAGMDADSRIAGSYEAFASLRA